MTCQKQHEMEQDDGFLVNFRLSLSNIDKLMAVQSEQFTLRNISFYFRVYKSHSGCIGIHWGQVYGHAYFPYKVRMVCKIFSKNGLERNFAKFAYGDLDELNYVRLHSFVPFDHVIKEENGYLENGFLVIQVDLKFTKSNQASGATGAKLQKIECSICYDGVGDKELSSLPCGHTFCTGCITRSLETRKKCPKCNKITEEKDLRRVFLDTA